MTSPDEISGLALWFKASDFSALADGATVGEAGVSPWVSAVGTSSGLQATAANRPTKETVGGITVVRFDGTNDRLNLDGDALTFSNNIAGVTVVARLRQRAPVPGTGAIVVIGVGGVSNARIYLRSVGGVWKMGGRQLDADVFDSVGTTATDEIFIHVLTGILDYANSNAYIWVDGGHEEVDTAFQADGNTSATNSLDARIGAALNDASFMPMDLYEVLVYNRVLDSTERGQIEAYFSPTRVKTGKGVRRTPWPYMI